jgi:type I restriction enzyme S subunit
MENLGAGIVGSLPVPLPSVGHQRAVIEALERSKSQVDLVVAAKQRLIDLLAEKRKAIIATAITRGLDPKVKLRHSGVPWLGEIPAHWDVTRLKFHLNGITQGWSPQCEAVPAGPHDWGVLKAGCVNGATFNEEENKRLPDSETPLPEIEVRPRDVVMSRANTTELVGSAAIVPANVRPRLMLSDKLYRLNVKVDELLPEFLIYFLRAPAGRFEFERTASGASNSMQNISQDVVQNLWLPVPPQEEQRAIVEHIAHETAKLDAVRAATERTIALLKERRSALITAAVTGQLDLTSEEGAAA